MPGRSTVHAMGGMAATSHPLATLVAVDVMRSGGNAVDACIAASAVLGVVEPESTGIGGDVFMLYCKGGTGDVVGYNGSGRAPKGLTSDWLLAEGQREVGANSVHAVTIPGTVEAWERIAIRHGRKDLGELLRPAIRFAEDGYVIAPRVAYDMANNKDKLNADPDIKRIFTRGGRPYVAGEVHRQPEYAAALREIAAKGAAGFYRGWVAEDIVAKCRALGGRQTLEDFALHEGEWVEPIATDYRGRECLQIPPNGQGIVTLAMLDILEGFELGKLDPLGIERLHLHAEAAKMAYALRDALVADTKHAEVPVAQLLDKAYAAKLRARIARDKVMAPLTPDYYPKHANTVYLTAVDQDRNVCSFINSTFSNFGTGIVAPKSGIALQNRGSGFTVEPGHPNCVAPLKRPMHTIIPGLVKQDGRVALSYGVMGAHYQPFGHVWVLTNMFDFGMDPQEAIDLPRCFHYQGDYGLERGIPEAAAKGLAALGHKVSRSATPWGGSQAIAIDWQRGTLTAGSDPRKDGCALGF